MGRFTKEMVNDYAEKLLIGLTDEENAMVLSEFDKIDSDINIITVFIICVTMCRPKMHNVTSCATCSARVKSSSFDAVIASSKNIS